MMVDEFGPGEKHLHARHAIVGKCIHSWNIACLMPQSHVAGELCPSLEGSAAQNTSVALDLLLLLLGNQ